MSLLIGVSLLPLCGFGIAALTTALAIGYTAPLALFLTISSGILAALCVRTAFDERLRGR